METCCKSLKRCKDTVRSEQVAQGMSQEATSYYQVSQNFWLAFFRGRFKMAVAGRTYCD